MSNEQKGLFSLGRVLVTQGASKALESNGDVFYELLNRHQTGDWGDVCATDAKTNDIGVADDLRILSSYRLEDGTKLWVITEWDRSVTTFLLPSEY